MKEAPKSFVHGITHRQRKAAKLVVEAVRKGQNITKGEIVKMAGYSDNIALQPSKVTESKGFLAALAELGLTKEFAVSALVEDIRLKPQRRAFELSIAGKWLGLEKKEEHMSSVTTIQNAVIMIAPPVKGSVEPLKD